MVMVMVVVMVAEECTSSDYGGVLLPESRLTQLTYHALFD